MKKVAAIMVSLGVILVIVGLVMVGVFGGEALKKLSWKDILSGSNHDLSKAEMHYELKEEQITNLTKIVVNTDVYAVYVLPSEDNVLSVKYVEPDDDEFKISAAYDEQSSTLTVTEKGTSNIHVGWFDWFKGDNFIVIYLPQTSTVAQSELSVTVNAASVKIEDMTLRSVKCDADTGSVNVAKSRIEDVNLETKTGSATVGELTCTNLTINTKTGSVTTTDTIVEKTTKIDVRTGSVNCDVTTNDLVINDNTGSVNFKVKANSISITTNTGSVTGTVVGAQAEYQIKVKKSTGRSNLSDQTVVNATKFLNVEVNTGSITINFEK